MSRTLIAGTAALVLLVSAVQAHHGGEVILDKKDKLTKDDPGYKPDLTKLGPNVKSDEIAPKLLKFITDNPHKSYSVKLKKGDKVIITMKSQGLDSVVIVEDDKKNIVDLNDDDPDQMGKSLDSKLVFTAPSDGEFRVIATCLHAVVMNKYGDYQLTIKKAK
jgi:hypothetical protein